MRTSDWPCVVGLNVGHDGGCAIVKGERVVAIAEERLNRTRYSAGWQAALLYCLSSAGVTIGAVDRFVFSSVGTPLPPGYTGGLESLGVDPRRVTTVDHHVSHAYGAFCLSGFDEATVVVLDSGGNQFDTESWFEAGKTLRKLGSNDPGRHRAKGIGPTYSAFSNFLGYDAQEAGKVMALASFGDPDCHRAELFSLGNGQVESQLTKTHEFGVVELAQRWGIDFGEQYGKDKNPRNIDTAAWLQAQTERVIVELVTGILRRTGARNLCLSGGLALNCVANERLRHAAAVQNLFVLPAASDRGQALGCALYGFEQLTGALLRLDDHSDAFGRVYPDTEIESALRREPSSLLVERSPRRKFGWHRESDISSVAAELVANGKIIGWFDGGSELGPRALGGRSILADPRTVAARDRLNSTVKHREWFRPFAPSVLEEAAADWFDLDTPSRHMLLAPSVRENRREEIPGVVHVDGTARAQTVDERSRPGFRRVIEQFGQLTGVPMVLNTSFNDQEPIVETPADALASFLSTDLDYLCLGDYLVEKR